MTVVERMRPTGTPGDRAIVVPIEYNWVVHGLGTGHKPGSTRIGPPFDAAKLPGVPAIVVKPEIWPPPMGCATAIAQLRHRRSFPRRC